MSKNFELMQQVGRGVAAPPIRVPSRVSVETGQEDRPVVTHFDLGEVAREEARNLVQRLFLSSQTDKAPRAVLFAGIDGGAGCSQICALVAETLRNAVSGSICIVEANLRSPSLPSLFGTTNHYGLTDALLREGPIRSFARPLELDNVWLLSCGSTSAESPSLLNGDRLKARIAELRQEFDYLLVDAPCLTRYAEGAALARLTDGLVLVLEANSTRKEAALSVLKSLRSAQIPVLGAVLNKRTFPIPESIYQRL
jgi:succinoglycan biosynthesis transport protein ExoP